MSELPTVYTDSKGRDHLIATMPYTYLCNALAKLERENMEIDETPMIQALKAQKAFSDAQYAEEQAAAERGEA